MPTPKSGKYTRKSNRDRIFKSNVLRVITIVLRVITIVLRVITIILRVITIVLRVITIVLRVIWPIYAVKLSIKLS